MYPFQFLRYFTSFGLMVYQVYLTYNYNVDPWWMAFQLMLTIADCMLTVDLTVLTDFKSWTESIAMRYGIVMILQLLFSSATFRYSGSVVYPIYLAIYSVIRYPDIIYLVCAPFSSYGYIYFCSTMNEYIYAENVHNRNKLIDENGRLKISTKVN